MSVSPPFLRTSIWNRLPEAGQRPERPIARRLGSDAVVARTALQGTGPSGATSRSGIHKIQHVVIIMQENRSVDNYFGTYPGSDGIPMKNGVPTVCVPAFIESKPPSCLKPYHNPYYLNVVMQPDDAEGHSLGECRD